MPILISAEQVIHCVALGNSLPQFSINFQYAKHKISIRHCLKGFADFLFSQQPYEVDSTAYINGAPVYLLGLVVINDSWDGKPVPGVYHFKRQVRVSHDFRVWKLARWGESFSLMCQFSMYRIGSCTYRKGLFSRALQCLTAFTPIDVDSSHWLPLGEF